jgi:hypothetical protein
MDVRVAAERVRQRRGQYWPALDTGITARTVWRILCHNQGPYPRDRDPLSGQVIRTGETATACYERACAGELVHVDMKKRIHGGGG